MVVLREPCQPLSLALCPAKFILGTSPCDCADLGGRPTDAACLCYIDTLSHVGMCGDGPCHTHTLGASGKRSLSGQASLLGPGGWGNSAWPSAQDAGLSPLPQEGPVQAAQAGWLAGRLLEGSHEYLWVNKEIAEKTDFSSSKCKAIQVQWTVFSYSNWGSKYQPTSMYLSYSVLVISS